MTHSPITILVCCIALLSVSGCKQADETNEKSQVAAPASVIAPREPTASEKLASENAKRARVTELTSLISTAQAQRESLEQQKTKIETQLATYQADSSATLDKLKAEMRALEQQKNSSAKSGTQSGTRQMDAFSERARNQLEQALAMDQEYQAQLTQTSEELRELDTKITILRAENESLQSSAR